MKASSLERPATLGKSGGRNNGLELARACAAGMVVYGHLIGESLQAKDLSLWVGPTAFPLLSPPLNFLWWPQEVFAQATKGSHLTVIGVALFFLLTGWLTPDMMARRSRWEYLRNRFFRIYPALIGTTVLCALIQCVMSAKMTVSAPTILATMTTLYREANLPPINAVVWTLAIEVRFYLFSYVVGAWTPTRLLAAILGALALFGAGWILGWLSLCQDVSFILFILVGVSLRLWAKEKARSNGALIVLALAAFNFVFWLHEHYRPLQLLSVYSQVVSLGLFLGFLYCSKWIGGWAKAIAAPTYSLYLLHCMIGFPVLALARLMTNEIAALGIALLSCVIASILSHRYFEQPFYQSVKPTSA